MTALPRNAFEMTEPYFDRPDQHKRFEELMVPSETLWMTLDCKGSGTGFVGITDKRLMFQDANWRKTRNVIVSVPLDRIHAVGLSSNYSFIGKGSGVLSIQAGDDDWAFEFKVPEKTRIAYLLLMSFVLSRETNTPDTSVAGVG